MLSEVVLHLESPLMTGGKRLKDNVLESLDYIPGHVLRAAFAKYILLRCPLYDPRKTDEASRYHYIYDRKAKECDGCLWHEACRSFSGIVFSFFYPENCDIIPFTAKICKHLPQEHGMRDLLTNPGRMRCRQCEAAYPKTDLDIGKFGRLESVSGYRRGGRKFLPKTITLTRTSINPFTGTALNAGLYSVTALQQGLPFTGTISGIEKLNIQPGQTIYVGSYNSVGLGRMKLAELKPPPPERNLLNLLRQFNLRLKEAYGDSIKTYIPILLKSDAKLGIETMPQFKAPLSNDDYRREWQRLILGRDNQGIEIEQIYSEQDIYRGYDTSREWGRWEKQPQVLTLKGTTFLLSTQQPLESILPFLTGMETSGIGNDRANGFGQVEIGNKLHVEGEIQ